MVNGLKVEDRLDGSSNFSSWKFRILITLEENDLLDYVSKDVEEPFADAEKVQWRKNKTMAKKILIDSVKDHRVPIISKLDSAKEMFQTLKDLYEFNNTSRALALRHQLLHVKMSRGESVTSYFMNILS